MSMSERDKQDRRRKLSWSFRKEWMMRGGNDVLGEVTMVEVECNGLKRNKIIK